MAEVEIYTWATCPYCMRAKALLTSKGVEFTEHRLDGDEDGRQQMSKRANGRTSVPQIFINGQHIGGNDDIQALNATGKLDPLLAQSA
jgi:glutaredoxin 3